MKIVLIGGTGFVGSGILSESLDRGHDVTAIVKNPDKLPSHSTADAHQAAMLPTLRRSHPCSRGTMS